MVIWILIRVSSWSDVVLLVLGDVVRPLLTDATGGRGSAPGSASPQPAPATAIAAASTTGSAVLDSDIALTA
jgi:hypothetical protein